MLNSVAEGVSGNKTVYLHIGFGKTGTSSIQEMFYENRDFFKSLGLYYPTLGLYKSAHHLLSRMESEPDNSKELKSCLIDINNAFGESGCSKMLISSEHLCFVAPGVADIYRDVFSDADVKVIMYVRRQEDLIPSVYLQWLKSGNNYRGGIEDFFAKTRRSYDFIQRLSLWNAVFGRENIIVRLFDARIISNVCQDFIGLIGVTVRPEIYTGIRANQSLNGIFDKAIRLLDKSDIGAGLRTKIIDNLVRASEHIPRNLITPLLNEELKCDIANEYSESNKELARYFLSDEEKIYLIGGV